MTIHIADLFAGVGGFRLALEGNPATGHPKAGNYANVFANQWEPEGQTAKQFAYRCYTQHFGEENATNTDLHKVVADTQAGKLTIPPVDMVTAGFPCQDYSVAKTSNQAEGITGKKGVLWWPLYTFITLTNPGIVLLENVDRLLKSPTSQRGRDFGIIIACLRNAGYMIEWQIINAADYGYPTKRRRVFILAYKNRELQGTLATAFPTEKSEETTITMPGSVLEVSNSFPGNGAKTSPFRNSGTAVDGLVTTAKATPLPCETATLGAVLQAPETVPETYWINDQDLAKWQYVKGAKRIDRTAKNGHKYTYSEGALPFPDHSDQPARTILTSEGGKGATRTKHAVTQNGKLRRLTPNELDALHGFPAGWTNTGMTDNQRAFCIGNSLVVGIPHRIGKEIANRLGEA